MFKKIVFLLFAFIIIIAAIGSCGSEAKPTAQEVNQPVTQIEEEPALELLEAKKMNKDSVYILHFGNNENQYTQHRLNIAYLYYKLYHYSIILCKINNKYFNINCI